MIVRVIQVYVKPEQIDAFKAVSQKNHEGSIREEGVLRFDVLQSDVNPGEFLLYEAYATEEATRLHKETEHYKEWKAAVEPMMASPRKSASYVPIAPVGKEAW